MPELFSLDEILAATGGRAIDVAANAVRAISIDSREIPEGALFVAIEGDRFDGHDFAADAVRKGAVAALVSEGKAGGLTGLPLIVVPEALEGLVALARAARARSKARIVAVTGSAGKTTTKEMIRVVLAGAGATHASIKSFNNHWGVPLMLARLSRTARFGVFEIGMNHAGEVSPLSSLVRPHIAVITTIAPAHLGFLRSMEAIADAKAEIFEGLEPGGTAVLGADHDYLPRLLDRAREAGVTRVTTFGFAENADVRILDAQPAGEGISARMAFGDETVPVQLPVAGRHMLSNAAAALCVARLCGVDLRAAAGALERAGAPEGRGEVLAFGNADNPLVVIDESYNANPASMRAALEVFADRPASGGRRVLVLGDMRELGSFSGGLHAELADPVHAARPDRVVLVGPQMRALAEALGPRVPFVHVQTAGEAGPAVLDGLALGDLVMVKGSNGVGLGRLVGQIRAMFEREDRVDE